jgi:hypothetical protein
MGKSFVTNSSMFHINTRNKHHFCTHNPNPGCSQKSTFYAGIKIFNSLPRNLTILKNEKAKFKAALRKYLNTHSFYSVDEFFVSRWSIILVCKVFILYYTKHCEYLCITCLNVILTLWKNIFLHPDLKGSRNLEQ